MDQTEKEIRERVFNSVIVCWEEAQKSNSGFFSVEGLTFLQTRPKMEDNLGAWLEKYTTYLKEAEANAKLTISLFKIVTEAIEEMNGSLRRTL
jgi:hypothetical protein